MGVYGVFIKVLVLGILDLFFSGSSRDVQGIDVSFDEEFD